MNCFRFFSGTVLRYQKKVNGNFVESLHQISTLSNKLKNRELFFITLPINPSMPTWEKIILTIEPHGPQQRPSAPKRTMSADLTNDF